MTWLRAPASLGAPELGGDHQAGADGVLAGPRGHHGAFANTPDLSGNPLDLGGEDVAPGHRDEFLGAPADHQSAVDEIAEIAGGEPVVGVQRCLAEVADIIEVPRISTSPTLAVDDAPRAAVLAGPQAHFHPTDGVTEDRELRRRLLPASVATVISSRTTPRPGTGTVTAQDDSAIHRTGESPGLKPNRESSVPNRLVASQSTGSPPLSANRDGRQVQIGQALEYLPIRP